jgi:hypothetical protein|tara:strand:+ start:464 stop:661 length:198 start_codon:yes stop_codon:yes gene_type:complete
MIIKPEGSKMSSLFIDEYSQIKKENMQLRNIAERLAVEKQNLEITLRIREEKILELQQKIENDKY